MRDVSPQERIQGMGFFAAGIVFNAVCLGRAAAGLDLGMIAAYLFWLFGSWRPSRKRLLLPYLLFIGLFCLHFAEEYFTGFYLDFPALFGTQWSVQGFVIFNLAWLAVFALSSVGVYYEKSIAYLALIFFALAGGILNGAAGMILFHKLQPDWHHALPHASSPNRSTVPRVVQYIRMMPSRWEYNPRWR
jgi:hypothetical protein